MVGAVVPVGARFAGLGGGAPATWEYAGTLTLKAAGLETVESGEARNTWFEILGQSLSVMARSIGSMVGHEVTCDSGAERAPDAEVRDWASVSLTFGDTPLAPLLVTLRPRLVEIISAPPRSAEPPKQPQPKSEPETAIRAASRRVSRTMDLLMDVDLPVSISFGKAQLPMKDVLKLTTGSIVELNRGVNDQVEVLVNQCLIARGEVVVVEGNYGVQNPGNRQPPGPPAESEMNSLMPHFGRPFAIDPFALVLAAAALCLVRSAARVARKGRHTEDNELASAVQALRADLESLASQIRDAPLSQALLAAPPRNGLNLTKRSQALRINRRGTAPAQIAAALELPLQEVELLLKVHRIVVSNL